MDDRITDEMVASAREALDSLDDFARMSDIVATEPLLGVLTRFIDTAAALSSPAPAAGCAEVVAAREALDAMDDYARMADIDPAGPRGVLERFITNHVRLLAEAKQRAATMEAALREAQQKATAWEDFARHQTWCADCAESVESCPQGKELEAAALLAPTTTASYSPHSFNLETPMNPIFFTKRLPNAQTPTRGSDEAAGFDLFAADIQFDDDKNTAVIDTGLSTAFPKGFVLHIYPRSGLASKFGIRLTNCVAVIDSDYRGPLKVLLTKDTPDKPYLSDIIKVGDRIAQAVLVKLPDTQWQEVEQLPESVRGEGGFGSTGTS